MTYHRVNTDLPNGVQRLIIIQPRATRGVKTTFELGRLAEDVFAKILDEVISLRAFLHTGTIEYDITRVVKGFNTYPAIDIRKYQPCGGEIAFRFGRGGLVPVACSQCGEKIEFVHRENIKVIQHMLFFLALRQMFPRLSACNLIDLNFDLAVGEQLFSGSDPLLGLIPVAYATLSLSGAGIGVGNLGFTLLPGIGIEDGFGDLDNWVRVLVYKWSKMTGIALNEAKFFSLGPMGANQK